MSCPYGARYFQDEERDYFGLGGNDYEQPGLRQRTIEA